MSKNGRTKNDDTSGLDRIRERRQQRQSTEIADWAAADAQLLLEAVAVVALRGGAIRFGYTRDGGAYSIGIYGSGEPYTEYVRPSEDIDYYLRGIIEDFGGGPYSPPSE
jgi:hypothetical protein